MSGSLRDKTNDKYGFRFKWPFPEVPTTSYRIKSTVMTSAVQVVSKILFLGGVNRVIPHNKERFLKALGDRNRPLITISNHRCNIDDPLMWSTLSLREFWQNRDRYRYTLAAHNICFTKQFHTTLFSLGRCVPCVRGEGVYQAGMNFCVEKLNENKWVHIFPEGRVCSNDENLLRFKWGVGRLLMDAKEDPIVLPIWCRNMNKVWPTTPPYYPRFGHTVDVHFGEPFSLASLKTKLQSNRQLTVEDRRKLLTDECQARMYQIGEDLGDIQRGKIDYLLKKHSILPSSNNEKLHFATASS